MNLTQTSEKSEYLKKVWVSCKTEEQRRVCENWITRLALSGEITREEKNIVFGLIDELKYAEMCPDSPPEPRDELRRLIDSVKDLRARVSKLENMT